MWVRDDGTCPSGHAAASVSGIYEASAPAAAPVEGAPKSRSSTGLWIALVVVGVLLACCAVAGLVSALSIPVFDSAAANARKRACFANQRVVEGAIQQYLASEPEGTPYPEDWPATMNALVPTYLREVPSCIGGGTYNVDDARVTCSVHEHWDRSGYY